MEIGDPGRAICENVYTTVVSEDDMMAPLPSDGEQLDVVPGTVYDGSGMTSDLYMVVGNVQTWDRGWTYMQGIDAFYTIERLQAPYEERMTGKKFSTAT